MPTAVGTGAYQDQPSTRPSAQTFYPDGHRRDTGSRRHRKSGDVDGNLCRRQQASTIFLGNFVSVAHRCGFHPQLSLMCLKIFLFIFMYIDTPNSYMYIYRFAENSHNVFYPNLLFLCIYLLLSIKFNMFYSYSMYIATPNSGFHPHKITSRIIVYTGASEPHQNLG